MIISLSYAHNLLYLFLRLQLYPPTPRTPPPPPFAAACLALNPTISRAGCSHHQLDRLITGSRSATKHKFMIRQVTIYCATVFWRRAIYTPI